MKLLDVAKAYMELEKLAEKELPLKVSYYVDKAIRQLHNPFNFYANKEIELVQKHEPVERRGSEVRFATDEITAKYNEEHKELDEIEEDITIKPIEINIDTNVGISRKSLKVLMDLNIVKIIGLEGTDD